MGLHYSVSYVAIPSVALCICIMLLLLFILICRLYCVRRRKQYQYIIIKGYIKCFNIICIMMFIAVSMIDLLHLIVSDIDHNILTVKHYDIVRVTSDGLYFVSSLLSYIILITKLHTV
eukprot:386250_1